MATLTNEWRAYSSASFSTGSATVKFYLDAKYSSQSVANNTTNVQTRLRYSITSGNRIEGAGYKFTCSYANTVSGSGTYTFTGTDKTITSGSSTITHNNDGTKSISLSASAYNKYWNFTKNLSATVSLPKINRLATIKSGTNFNDEGNPTITFNNPSGMNIRPYLNFYDNSNTRVYRQYGTLGSLTSPYTWSLTSEQRTAILNACNQQNTYKVAEGIQSFNGSTLIEDSASSIDKTFTIIDADPMINITYQEMNDDVIELLGTDEASVIISNVSTLKITGTPTTQKGATVSKIVFDGVVSGEAKQSPYTITKDVLDVPLDKKYIDATVIDSRGNSGWIGISPTFFTVIDYKKVKQNSFSFKRVNPTSSNVRLQVDSVYYDVNFAPSGQSGGTDIPNVPTVKYKIGEEGRWITIPSTEYDINTDNTLSVDYIIENAINYRDGDTFYVEVSDLLSSWTNKSKISKGIPVFEFGDDEVQVNGDLLLADINRENVINVRDALGGGGTTDYSLLTNKPQINGVTLSGNKTTSDLGITIPTQTSQLTNDSGFITNTVSNLTNYTKTTDLGAVATSNDYDDLDNTPTIPTVGNAKTYYGVCNTGSFTGTKQVTISNFVLESGATVIIKFTHGNDYTNTPLLQINNETAKYMKIGSNTLTYKWGLDAVLTFIYDGTDFILIEPERATSSIYGLTTLTDSVSSTSTTSSATPNSVKQAYDLANSKQDALVSGTNIKTINNTSLLGSGNINIGGGGTATDVKINGTSITSGGEADIITEGTYNSSTNKIATMSDIPTPTVLYNNTSGSNASITLSDDVSNYSYLEIFYGWTSFGTKSTRYDVALGGNINLDTSALNNNYIYWASSEWTPTTNKINLAKGEYWRLGTSGSGARTQQNRIFIHKVLGYK